MGSNPMQSMKRNSILIGIVIGLVIGAVLGVVAYFGLSLKGFIATGSGSGGTVAVTILNKDIKSGDIIKQEDLQVAIVPESVAPTNRVEGQLDATAKIDLNAGTILTTSMLSSSSTEIISDDLRIQEYNMIALPSTLLPGTYIDVRLQLPNGGDYIVVSKKKVLNCNQTTIWLRLYEEEIELLSNAIIEYYIVDGSKLYVTSYTDPGMQAAATGTYVPNAEVAKVINSSPNITAELVNRGRYAEELKSLRNDSINSVLSTYYKDEDGDGRTAALENIEKKIQEEIKNLQQARKAYYDQLNAAAAAK